MSDKLVEDFDLYYKELENFTGRFKTDSQAVETDKMLSRVGKSEKITELKAEHFKNVDDLSERFQTEFDGRVLNIKDNVEGKKRTPFWILLNEDFQKAKIFPRTNRANFYSRK